MLTAQPENRVVALLNFILELGGWEGGDWLFGFKIGW